MDCTTAHRRPSSVGHKPNGRWTFDDRVTEVFEDMLRRSIPQYEVMRQACFALGQHYVRPQTAVIDLGCSRGDALAPFVERFSPHNTFIGVEISQPMLKIATDRFRREIGKGLVAIRNLDLRAEFPQELASLMLSILTVQFTPIEYRLQILQRVYQHLIPGGAFIFVEKVLGQNADLNDTLAKTYHEMKRQNGYSQDEIDRKRISLEGVLVPLTADWNVRALEQAGFRQVECFWRLYNFAGWLAVK